MSLLGQVRQWVQQELAPVIERLERLEKAVGIQENDQADQPPAANPPSTPSTTVKAAPARGRGSTHRTKTESIRPEERAQEAPDQE